MWKRAAFEWMLDLLEVDGFTKTSNLLVEELQLKKQKGILLDGITWENHQDDMERIITAFKSISVRECEKNAPQDENIAMNTKNIVNRKNIKMKGFVPSGKQISRTPVVEKVKSIEQVKPVFINISDDMNNGRNQIPSGAQLSRTPNVTAKSTTSVIESIVISNESHNSTERIPKLSTNNHDFDPNEALSNLKITLENLHTLSRKQIQFICKGAGIKSNQKSELLIDQFRVFTASYNEERLNNATSLTRALEIASTMEVLPVSSANDDTADDNQMMSLKSVASLQCHEDIIIGLQCISSSKYVFSAGWDDKLRIWSTKSKSSELELKCDISGPEELTCGRYMDKSNLIAACGMNGDLMLYDSSRGTPTASLELQDDFKEFTHLNYSESTHQIAATVRNSVLLWDYRSDGSSSKHYHSSDGDLPYRCVSFNEMGHHLLIARGSVIDLLDIRMLTGQRRARGSSLLRSIDTAHQREIDHIQYVNGVSGFTDVGCVATNSRDGSLHINSLSSTTSKSIVKLDGHSNPSLEGCTTSVGFSISRSTRFIATPSCRNSISIYDMKYSSKNPIEISNGCSSNSMVVAWDHDPVSSNAGNISLIGGTANGEIHLFEV